MASEASRRANQKYALRNKERISERMKGYRLSDPPRFMWKAAKARARQKGIPFTISVEDVVIPDLCPVLGTPISMTSGRQGGNGNSASLDRIIPELGYVPGNVQVLSRRANVMKSDASPDELKKFANWIQKTYE